MHQRITLCRSSELTVLLGGGACSEGAGTVGVAWKGVISLPGSLLLCLFPAAFKKAAFLCGSPTHQAASVSE